MGNFLLENDGIYITNDIYMCFVKIFIPNPSVDIYSCGLCCHNGRQVPLITCHGFHHCLGGITAMSNYNTIQHRITYGVNGSSWATLEVKFKKRWMRYSFQDFFPVICIENLVWRNSLGYINQIEVAVSIWILITSNNEYIFWKKCNDLICWYLLLDIVCLKPNFIFTIIFRARGWSRVS